MPKDTKVRMIDSDKARAVLADKVREVKDLARDLISVRPPSEQDRFYLLRVLRSSLLELEDYRYPTHSEQEELGL